MNTYVVAYWNDHNGELLQEVVEANSALEAVMSYMEWEDIESMEELHEVTANSDCVVSVINITPKYTKKFEPALPSMAAYH